MPDEPRVSVERELCLGTAYCVAIAPAAFALDSEGIAVVVDVDDASDEELIEAEETCPAGAIRLGSVTDYPAW